MKGESFFQALKVTNIVLTGLILVRPKTCLKIVSTAYNKVKNTAFRIKRKFNNNSASKQDAPSLLEEGELKDKEIQRKFKVASLFNKKQNSISTENQLELYGLYKQSVFGACQEAQPSSLFVEKHMKWSYWEKCKNLSKADAMILYIDFSIKLFPQLFGILEQASQEEFNKLEDENLEASDNEQIVYPQENILNQSSNTSPTLVKQKPNTSQKLDLPIGQTISKMTTEIGSEFLKRKKSEEDVSSETREFFSLIDSNSLTQIQKSINQGFNLLSKNNQGTTALHYCIENDHLDLLDTMIDFFPDVNAQDSDGYTPLYIAALNENSEVILKLLNKGADPFIKDHENQTAYDIASSSSKIVIDQYLSLQQTI